MQRASTSRDSAAGGRAIPPGSAATPIPSADGRFPCRAVPRLISWLASAGSEISRDCVYPDPDLPGASVPGAFSSFPTIRQHNRPMARQDPSLFARSSASPAIPEFGVLVG